MSEHDSDFQPEDLLDTKPVSVVEHSPVNTSPASKKWDYPKWVDTFQHWLGNAKSNEVKNLVDFFDRSSEWWATAKELTSDEFQQKSVYLKRDLAMFYRHYKQDMSQSEFVQTIKESAWKELAEMTDKSQIEWQELQQDFKHQGTYEAGEWVGMGIIVCKSCHYKMEFVHPEELMPCPECGGTSFLREALAP
jgi:hypothetical protein